MSKLSIIIPVYYNSENLMPLYDDIKKELIDKADFEYEIVMVDDGSNDDSFEVMTKLAEIDSNIKTIKLSRNFGSHAAILCGLNNCTGDCAVIKAADLQEPTSLLVDMFREWQKGFNVVLAVRSGRDETKSKTFFANFYYWLVRNYALSEMPKNGFDIFLIDRKVIQVLELMDEKNTAITGQILWSGFKTSTVEYMRKAREIGKSRWTLKKKIKLVKDTLFSFSTLPITAVWVTGIISCIFSLSLSIYSLVGRLTNNIPVSGYTTLIIVSLLSLGIIMLTLGVICEYLYRTFDGARNRPVYIEEKRISDSKDLKR